MSYKKTAGHVRGGHESKTPPKSIVTGFRKFGLGPKLDHTIEKLGWTTPTPVQLQAIPIALQGHDLIALAQTGTGKTGAYLIPVLEALSAMPPTRPMCPRCVILAPTRELVQQIDGQVRALTMGEGLRSMTIFGGVSERPQISQLKRGVDLVSATPGRLLDLMGQGVIKFDEVTHCVLDEADRMFDMGFIRDLKRILEKMPTLRQTLLFSATMPPEIQLLTEEFLNQPREVRLSINLPPPELKHEIWEMEASKKSVALELLLEEDYDSVLVFTRTKHRADSVARKLSRQGEAVAVLHGNRSQNQRDLAMARFKQGDARVLVATDVASRGLDIVGIGLVINFDIPREPDDYIHRVGRTARAKKQGRAVSFMVEEELKTVRKIETLLNHRIVRYEHQYAPEESFTTPEPEPEPVKPKRVDPRKGRRQPAGKQRQGPARSEPRTQPDKRTRDAKQPTEQGKAGSSTSRSRSGNASGQYRGSKSTGPKPGSSRKRAKGSYPKRGR